MSIRMCFVRQRRTHLGAVLTHSRLRHLSFLVLVSPPATLETPSSVTETTTPPESAHPASQSSHAPSPGSAKSTATAVDAAAVPSRSPFAGDVWLDANAVWRRSADAGCGADDAKEGCTAGLCGYYRDGVVTTGVSESCVGWFRRSGGVWALPPGGGSGGGGGEGDGGGPWEAFSAREVGGAGREGSSGTSRRVFAKGSLWWLLLAFGYVCVLIRWVRSFGRVDYDGGRNQAHSSGDSEFLMESKNSAEGCCVTWVSVCRLRRAAQSK